METQRLAARVKEEYSDGLLPYLPMKATTKVSIAASVLALSSVASVAYATHAWGPYHWARTANPFTLNVGDNVSSAWDAYLAEASTDWSASAVLDTTVVAGQGGSNCKSISGTTQVCNRKYGATGWLGLAQIWVSGSHITKGVAKMNDTYFNTSTYNTPPWRRLVMCQEIAHTFGLAHQDETFSNPNLGSCMDYTSNPAGPPSNEHPNAHDFEQLETSYAHLDSSTTLKSSTSSSPGKSSADLPEQAEWGKVVRSDGRGRPSLFERDLGNDERVFTFVIWAE